MYYSSDQIITRNIKCYDVFFLQTWNSYLAVTVSEIRIPIVYLPWLLCIYSSGPKINRNLNNAKMQFSANLEILPWEGGDLSHGQTQNGANFDLGLNFTLQVRVKSPIKR